ncbi:MAG: acyl carrier protein [Nitrospirales bacterium]|nr:acyl carrier protein [Nitrospirales bacterium]
MKSAPNSLRDQVFHTLGKYLRMDPARLRPDDSLRDDLGLDSLQTIELVYEVESAFDLQIPDEDFGRMQTIQDVVAYLSERITDPKQSKALRSGRTASKSATAQPPSPTRNTKRRIS